jgi:hypothetical protein
MVGVGDAEPEVEVQANVCGKVPSAVESLMRNILICVPSQLAFQPSAFKL